MRRDTRTFDEKLAERNARLDALQQTLTGSVQALVTSEDWIRAITFATRFRSRSFNNTLLIWAQHSIAHAEGRVPSRTPTHVAGFEQWRQLGRHVMKGQSGYQILAPVTARMASSQPDNPDSWRRLARGEQPARGEVARSRIVGVKPAYVWDVSQTDGKPVPDLPAPTLLTGQAPAGLWDGLASIVAEHGFTLHDTPDAASIGGANGVTHWTHRTVHVRLDMDDAARCRTLAHEVGHLELHTDDLQAATDHRDIAEVEAESLALMITAAHGLDASQYTIPYVATWAASRPGQDPVLTVQSTAARVRSAALRILDRLDTPKIPDGTPPGLTARLAAAVSEQVSADIPRVSTPPDTDRGRRAMDQPAWCGREAGHVLLHNPEDRVAGPACRGLVEVEAESVAYLVAANHGLPTDDCSFAYIAAWAGRDADAVTSTATRVLGAARVLIEAADPTPSVDPQAAARLAAAARDGAERAEALAGAVDSTSRRLAGALNPDHDRLRVVLMHANQWFQDQARGSAVFASTVTDRGYTVEQATSYGLGMAPAGWTGLVDHLRGQGHTDADLLAAGVASTARNGRLIDRFRGRITFPIHDRLGVVGFTARDTTGQPEAPKYLNSPASGLFDKSRLLFGTQHIPRSTVGRQAITTVVLAEGPWDALAATHTAGGDVVGLAACGTSVTDHHLGIAEREAPSLVLAPDTDPAGITALGRTLAMIAQRGGRHPAAAVNPGGKDLGELLATGGRSAVRTALEQAQPAGIVYAAATLASRPAGDYPEARIAAARAAAAHTAGLTLGQRAGLGALLMAAGGIGHEAALNIVSPPAAASPKPAAAAAGAAVGPAAARPAHRR